jgi:CheY-like chemotaxis protein
VSVAVILLVEDDPNDVLLTRRAFAKAGVSASLSVVEDGDAAVDYLAGTGPYADRTQYPLPTIVLLDLKLPRRSGLEVLTWIRQQSPLKRIPVVVLTSSRESVDVNRAYDQGANSYLVKPVSFEELAKLMHALNVYWDGWNVKPEMGAA